MAGSYPDAPGPRMMWDRDCAAIFSDGSTSTVLSLAQRQQLNDEATAGYIKFSSAHGTLSVLFPQARSIVGHFCTIWQLETQGNYQPTVQVSYSTNTSTGLDGTWTNIGSTFTAPSVVTPNYRTGIVTAAVASATAIRWTTSGSWWADYLALHVYGAPVASSDRLAFWHPTFDQEVSGAYFDFGNTAQGTAEVRPFRLKNLSSTKTASTISATLTALTDPSPSLLTQYSVTNAAGNAPALTSGAPLASLAPGIISGTYSVTRATAASAAIGASSLRVVVSASTWS